MRPQDWQTVYENAIIQLERNVRSGRYSLYDRTTKSHFFLPWDEAVQQWETLYEDEVMRLRHHKNIAPLYVLINKLTGALLIIIAKEDDITTKEDERTLRFGVRVGAVIPIPGGL